MLLNVQFPRQVRGLVKTAQPQARVIQHQCPRNLSCNSTKQEPPSISWLQSCTSQQEQTKYDAVVVLAGGLTDSGGLPPWVQRRLDAAADIQTISNGCQNGQKGAHIPPILLLGAGTPHKPAVVAPGGQVIHESTSCANYLISKGIATETLFKESSSYDTVGNGYFSLVIHALPAQWTTLAVISSEFHIDRTRAIFDTLYSLGGKQIYKDESRFQLDYYGVSDDGLFSETDLTTRVQKEQKSVQQWYKDMEQIKDLNQFHAWLHDTHLCYSVTRQQEMFKGTQLPPELLASY